MAVSPITFAGNSVTGSAASRVVVDDAAMAAGDVRFVIFSVSNETITTPTGWTLVSVDVIASTRRIYVFRRQHPGGSETSHTFSFSGTANHSMIQFAARGADLTTPVDVAPSAASATTGTAVAAPTRTTVTAGAVLISAHFTIANGSGITLSLPSGMTSIATGAGNGTSGHAYRVAHEARPTAGATGSRTSTSSSSNPWGAVAFAIRPAAGGGAAATSLGGLAARARGTVQWVGDAETGDFSQLGNPVGGIDQLSPQTRAVVTSPRRRGTYAFEFAVNGVASENGTQRSEGRAKGLTFTEGDDLWIGGSYYLPSGFPVSPGSWQVVMQLKTDVGGTPPVSLNVEGGRWQLQGGFGHPVASAPMPAKDLGPAVTDVWTDFLFHVKFSANPAIGEVTVWRDGALVLAPYKPPGGTLYPGGDSYLKFGLYRDPTLPYGAETKIVLDEFRVGTIRAAAEVPIPATVTVTLGPLTARAAVPAFITGAADIALGALTVRARGNTTVDLRDIVRTTARRRTLHELWCVARIPQQAGPPTLIPVDPIEWSGLSWTDELSRPQTLSASVAISSLPESIRERARHMADLPSELWLYRDGRLVFAGQWTTWLAQADTLTLQAIGLLGYLRYREIGDNPVFTQVDQALIVKSLIDSTQSRDFGHLGLDTSGITPTGVLRDASYRLAEGNNLAQRLEELGRRENGFDLEVDPATRAVQLWSPQQGTDRSEGPGAVVFDARNITDPTVSCSVAPGDVANVAVAVGTSATDHVYGITINLELMARFGVADHTARHDGVSEQPTIDAHAADALAARDQPLLIPGPDIRIDDDTDLDLWSAGDTVAYQLHDALAIRGAWRIRKRTVRVAPDGTETVTPEFA